MHRWHRPSQSHHADLKTFLNRLKQNKDLQKKLNHCIKLEKEYEKRKAEVIKLEKEAKMAE